MPRPAEASTRPSRCGGLRPLARNRRTREVWFRAMLIGAALWPSAASAQDQPDPASEARLHLGPLALTPTMVTNIGYDSNVFNSAEDAKGDLVASFRPQADGWLRLGRVRLSGTGQLDFVYFNHYESERAVNRSLRGTVELPLNRVRFFGTGSTVHSEARLNAEVDERAPHTDNSGAAGVEVRLGGDTFLAAEVRRSRFAYGEDAAFTRSELREVLNRHTDGYAVTLRHRLTPLTTIALAAEELQDHFDFTPLRNSRSLRITPGVEFSPFALLDGKAYVGVRRFTPDDPSVPPYTGLVASIDLAYTLLGTTRFQARVNRDVAYSVEVVHPYYLLTDVSLSVIRRVSETWDVGGTVGIQRLAYRSLVLPATPAPGPVIAPQASTPQVAQLLGGRTDRLFIWGAGLGYRVGPDTRVGVSADYYRRHSVLENRTYRSVRITSVISYGF